MQLHPRFRFQYPLWLIFVVTLFVASGLSWVVCIRHKSDEESRLMVELGISDVHRSYRGPRILATILGWNPLYQQVVEVTIPAALWTDETIKGLQRLPHLEALYLREAGDITIDETVLAAFAKLDSFGLSGSAQEEIKPKVRFTSGLDHCGCLTNIDIADFQLSKTEIHKICRAPSLKYLKLHGCDCEPESIRELATIRSLEFLDIRGSFLDEEIVGTIEYLYRELPSCGILY